LPYWSLSMTRLIWAAPLAIVPAVLALIGSEATWAASDSQAPVVAPRKGRSETIHLFNGKNLDGWEGYKDLWSVKDGVIVARNLKPLKFSTYLLTKKKYSDFRLVLAARL